MLAIANLHPAHAQTLSEPPRLSTPVPSDAPFTGGEVRIGLPTAPHTLTIYLSTTCSHCAAFHAETWPELRRRLIEPGEVRVVIRELPTAPVSVSAAGFLIARCRGEARYWPTVERLLEHQAEVLQAPSLQEAVTREALIAGLNNQQAQLCLSDPAAIEAINARRQAALAAGIDSTPFFYVDGRPLRAGARLAERRYEGGEIDMQQLIAAFSARSGRQRKGG